jgi:hypothetical protein
MTEDTTWSEQWAPAVTHETRRTDVHEVREEHIHREIHQYHVRRQIQPVIEYEILPPRHFVHLEGGGYAEVSDHELPVGTPDGEWITREVAAQLEEGSSLVGCPGSEDKNERRYTRSTSDTPISALSSPLPGSTTHYQRTYLAVREADGFAELSAGP